MTKTSRRTTNKSHKKNKTAKNKKCSDLICPIGLKSFEEKFSKNISASQLRKSNSEKKKEFVKELLTKFAPSSIKPEDDFYDYINYLWLKNVSLENQQKYIVQVDDFRLAQDKVYGELNDIILDIKSSYVNLESNIMMDIIIHKKENENVKN
jgi:hypothetical protein